MIEKDHSIVINRPVDEVFAYVSNARNDPNWNADTQSCEPFGEPRVGQTREFVVKIFGRRKGGTAEITEYEPDQLLTIETRSGVPVHLRTKLQFESGDGITRINEHMEAKPRSTLLKLIQPIMGYTLQKQRKNDLATLKEILEEQPRPDT